MVEGLVFSAGKLQAGANSTPGVINCFNHTIHLGHHNDDDDFCDENNDDESLMMLSLDGDCDDDELHRV